MSDVMWGQTLWQQSVPPERIMFLLTGFSQGITAGFAILISQRYGAHDADGVKQAVANGTLLSVLFTLFLNVFPVCF